MQNTRHVCVEGWDVVGRFGGARLSDFLSMIGADRRARFLTVTCADDYYESLDIETALHPQSLLCYEMYDRRSIAGTARRCDCTLPTKLGYKHAKYLMTLEVDARAAGAAQLLGRSGIQLVWRTLIVWAGP